MSEQKHTPEQIKALADQFICRPVSRSIDEIEEAGGMLIDLLKQRDELLNALHVALPFVEDHEGDTFYKPGAVKKAVQTIRSAIASATYQFSDATKMIGAPATANYPHGSLGEDVESKGGAA